jgi:hypothetical protein
MDEKQLRSHQRINDILLGPLERPALAWLAKKMPAWVTPDLLTGLGFAASILIFVSYWLIPISQFPLLPLSAAAELVRRRLDGNWRATAKLSGRGTACLSIRH